ncbi:hypothetical protein KORDIASMS9_03337 [Kordia sp. SMS9]|uniref:hypothetical protein n=1 Tax=Kordia sp. SMS9 TaxID=2282170 RepID=UPI000E104306|nr:hypothetical protein [Kordia sp. SMS9]AXG71082.1 hypothetical protein KORDIASMS9_03337 [Kordia sp. SMS9]
MSKILNIKGAKEISKAEQRQIHGGIGLAIDIDFDLKKCGCDCAGRVTGPWYCNRYIACPQVYTCDDITASI